MALEFICSNVIEKGKKIIIPRCSNLYKIALEDCKIRFYCDNPGINRVELNTWQVPENAREIDFQFDEIKTGGPVIFPRFYDAEGNLLKIGNR